MPAMRDAVDEILDQWARERPDLDRSPMGVVGRIARLAKAHEAIHARTFAEFGLQPDEFDVLATLRRHGTPYELNPRELLRAMMVGSGTMTHRLDKLERLDLVARGPDPTDRRGVLVRLTARGKDIVDRAVEAHVRREDELLEGLAPAERRQLADLLRRLAPAADGRR
jgi:DNA-binding MarR family transcriptional regulator